MRSRLEPRCSIAAARWRYCRRRPVTLVQGAMTRFDYLAAKPFMQLLEADLEHLQGTGVDGSVTSGKEAKSFVRSLSPSRARDRLRNSSSDRMSV
jgi:hypothetical protein